MEDLNISPEAAALLLRRLAKERVAVTRKNRPLYRELVEAGLMYPVHTLVNGQEGYYRPTDAACDLRDAISANSSPTRLPSPAGSPSPGG